MIEGQEVRSPRGVIGAQPAEAARIGAELMAQGGNAFDAAAAAALAACMLLPASAGIAGYGGCAVVREGTSGRVLSVDFNSVAPRAAREDMYELVPRGEGPADLNANEYSCRVKDQANVYGALAVGVPGVLAGVGTLAERWGRLGWPAVVAPAQRLLSDGFPYGETASAIRAVETQVRRHAATTEHLLIAGELPSPDDRWHRPGMEATLARLASVGWRDLYQGELGRRVVEAVQAAGGILALDDMTAYEVRVAEPDRTTYRDAVVSGAVLANGSLSVLQMLNMMEWLPPTDCSPAYWHRLAEVLKLGWRDRLTYLADPDFAPVPVGRLLSKEYAAGRAEMIRQYPERIDRLPRQHPPDPTHGTLHLSAADADGNVVGMTYTHGMAFGSCFAVPETGLILGHGMCRLDPRPGHANSVAGGKRPLNNTAPVLIELPDRCIAAGLPGGRRIVSSMVRIVQALVDERASLLEAATGPRAHAEGSEPVEITPSVGDETIGTLRAMGHEVQPKGVAGIAHCAEWRAATGDAAAGSGSWAAGLA
jgi:gamma-glutamyltranspeptidase / glutathione hydrolase